MCTKYVWLIFCYHVFSDIKVGLIKLPENKIKLLSDHFPE